MLMALYVCLNSVLLSRLVRFDVWGFQTLFHRTARVLLTWLRAWFQELSIVCLSSELSFSSS